MGSEWQHTTLGECLNLEGGSILTGPFGTLLKAAEYTYTGVPVISVSEVGFGRIELKSHTPRVDETITERLPKYLLREGDIVFARKGAGTAVERSALVKADQQGWFLGSDGIRVRLPRSIDARYVSYWLQSKQHRNWMKQHAVGTTMPALNEGIVKRIPVSLPPLSEQKRIAHILGTLDEKIELNRRMNATLEAMARALFQSWFVDFDPVRAKMDGRKPEGMDEATATLFPNSLQNSEAGEIPRGWDVGRIQDCCVQILNGGTPRRDEPCFWERGNIPWLTSGEVRQPIITATDNFITEEGLAESSAKWVPPLSTVVALYGATAGQVSFLALRLTTNQAVCALVPKKIFSFFNYLAMRSATNDLERKAVGSAQQNISKGIVEDTPVVLPPTVLVHRFSEAASSLFERWISNLHQSHTLATLRASLLPELLSGAVSET